MDEESLLGTSIPFLGTTSDLQRQHWINCDKLRIPSIINELNTHLCSSKVYVHQATDEALKSLVHFFALADQLAKYVA